MTDQVVALRRLLQDAEQPCSYCGKVHHEQLDRALRAVIEPLLAEHEVVEEMLSWLDASDALVLDCDRAIVKATSNAPGAFADSVIRLRDAFSRASAAAEEAAG